MTVSRRRYLLRFVGLSVLVFISTLILGKIAQDVKAIVPPELPTVDKHLFIDDALIDVSMSTNYRISIHPPKVLQRVITADMPWEDRLGFYHWAPVVRDWGAKRIFGGRYTMNYPVWVEFSDGTRQVFSDALAVSNDGVHWTKPNVGLVDFDGSINNNLGFFASPGNIDPNAPSEERYKKFGYVNGRFAITHYASEDDPLNLKSYDAPHYLTPIPILIDGTNKFIWNDSLKQYMYYLRGWNGNYSNGEWRDNRRSYHLGLTADVFSLPWLEHDHPFLNWPLLDPPRYAITSEIPLVAETDSSDWGEWDNGRANSVDLYTWDVVEYPWADDTYLVFPWLYYHYSSTTYHKAANGNDGEFEVQLATSRDGESWTRYRPTEGYPPYLGRGTYDGNHMYMMASGIDLIKVGDKIYQYFLALPRTKGGADLMGSWGPFLDEGPRQEAWALADKGGIYLAEQRFDGFASVIPENSNEIATVVTTPFIFSGNSLYLNGMTNAGGQIRVSILDADAKEIAGFSLEESEVITGDFLDQKITWQGKEIDPTIQNSSIRLKFEIKNAKVYAFRFETGVIPTQTPTPTPHSDPNFLWLPMKLK